MHWIEDSWYREKGWSRYLAPIASLYGSISAKRRKSIQANNDSLWQSPVPVIVVGNITVGGTGKTPVTLALIEHLKTLGYAPGIVSRGYGGKAFKYPYEVRSTSPAAFSGDEPLLIKLRSKCPVVVDPDRVAAAKHLLNIANCDVIISDDGLQHYALKRDIELAVVDGQRGLGNKMLMPAGPLREPAARLNEVNFILVNGGTWQADKQPNYRFSLEPSACINIESGEINALDQWEGRRCHAIAGIGNPSRFFDTLASENINAVTTLSLPDHYNIAKSDVQFNDDLPVLMTEKDAVKCVGFSLSNLWYLPVTASLPQQFLTQISSSLENLRDQTI